MPNTIGTAQAGPPRSANTIGTAIGILAVKAIGVKSNTCAFPGVNLKYIANITKNITADTAAIPGASTTKCSNTIIDARTVVIIIGRNAQIIESATTTAGCVNVDINPI